MPLKLLAVGDLHLGRQPTRLPDALADRAAALGPAGAWERVVAAALDEGVNAVALAGDVVERENDFFEAYRALKEGVRRLGAHGIRVLAVSGNHDGPTLPRLADEIAGFELLGRDGAWQSATIEAAGERLTLWGWSFPQARVTESPMPAAAFERRAGINLGLLHCDRDQPASPYAPVTTRELHAAGLDGWLLGHIHQPDRLSPSEPMGYLGSAAGLDPGDSGARGPWLLAIESGRIHSLDHWPMAPLRWERLAIPLDGVTEPAEARARLLAGIRELDEALQRSRWQPEAVGLRLRFTGRSRLGERELAALLPEDARADVHQSDGVRYFVERVTAEILPEIPLEELARRSDPPGLLAQRLLVLDRPAEDPERHRLIRMAQDALAPVVREGRWEAIAPDAPDDDAVADWLRRAGRSALEQLLAQREDQ